LWDIRSFEGHQIFKYSNTVLPAIQNDSNIAWVSSVVWALPMRAKKSKKEHRTTIVGGDSNPIYYKVRLTLTNGLASRFVQSLATIHP